MEQSLREAGIRRISLPTPFPVGPVNAYLVNGPPVTLIDTGPATDEAFEALSAALGDAGMAVRDIERILVTHGHVDHMGLVPRIVAQSGAQSFAHPHAVAQWREHDRPEERRTFYGVFLRNCGVPDSVASETLDEWESYQPADLAVHFDHELGDGDQIGPFTAWHVPGHSPSDTILLDRDRGIAFTGDHILPGTTPNPIVRRTRPGQARVKALVEYQQSLRRTREMDIGVACPGHGDPFVDHRALIDALLDRHRIRTENVLGLLNEFGTHTAFTLARLLLPKVENRHVVLAVSATVGYLEVLEEQGRVQATWCDGVMYWSAGGLNDN